MSSEIQQVLERLNAVDGEISKLRDLVRSYLASQSGQAASTESNHPYIERVSTILGNEPIIKGTRTPVRAIVEHWKFGDTPEEVARKLPHLRLAQIFDALSYYDDHRDEIEHYIALNRVPVDD